jgi:hypothetical protein
MGLADLLAAMPDDVRADALTQLNDSDLAQLPPQVRRLQQRVHSGGVCACSVDFLPILYP